MNDKSQTINKQDVLEICRRDYIAFAKYVDPAFEAPMHVRWIAERLQKVESGEIKRFMLTMPPRSSKSYNASQMFPLWLIGKHPTWRLIIATFSQELSNEWGDWVKTQMDTPEFKEVFPACTISKGSHSKRNIGTTAGGRLIYVSINGTVQGRSADCLILDDALSADDADSEKHQQRLWMVWRQILYPRLMPGGRIIVLQQRLRHNDFIGDLLDPEKNVKVIDWHRMDLPAIATEDTNDWRKPGEALWPEWFDLKTLEDTRNIMGIREFEALYQGKPSPEEGDMFKAAWLKDESPEKIELLKPIIAFADTATSEKTTADYSAVVVAARTSDNRIFIIHSIHKRFEFPELVKWLKQIITDHHLDALLIEKASSGTQVIQTLQRTMTFPVIPVIADKSKKQRAAAVLPYFESGKVVFNRRGDHSALISELLAFPNDKRDDLVDACVGAVQYLAGKQFQSALRRPGSGGGFIRPSWRQR